MPAPRLLSFRRALAQLGDRVLVPTVFYVAAVSLIQASGAKGLFLIPVPTLAALAGTLLVASSPLHNPVLRLLGLRVVSHDGAEPGRMKRMAYAGAWCMAIFGFPGLLTLVVEALVVYLSGRGLQEHAVGTSVVAVGGDDELPQLPDAPPTLVPESLTEAGGLRVASGFLRILSTALDAGGLAVATSVALLLPLTLRMARVWLLDADGVATMTMGCLGLYVLVQVVLMLAWSTSLAKGMLGLRVVALGGGPASIGDRVARLGLTLVSLAVPFVSFGLGFAALFAHLAGHLPVHDRWTRTTVVRVR